VVRLKRNNRREWFNAHRDEHKAHVRAPMIAGSMARRRFPVVCAGCRGESEAVALPDHRDIRFSEDKKPYKTHVAASCRTRRSMRARLHLMLARRRGSAADARADDAAAARGPRAHRRE
jgi:uncharacterized protein (DUF2461 family)